MGIFSRIFKRKDGTNRFNTRRDGKERTWLGKAWRKAAGVLGAAGLVVGGVAAAPIVGPALASAGLAAKGALASAVGGAAKLFKGSGTGSLVSQLSGGAVERLKDGAKVRATNFVGSLLSPNNSGGGSLGNVSGNLGDYEFSGSVGSSSSSESTENDGAGKILSYGIIGWLIAKILGVIK